MLGRYLEATRPFTRTVNASRRLSTRSFVAIAQESGVSALLGTFPDSDRFDSKFSGKLSLTKLDNGVAKGILKISQPLCNSFGTLHGGATATLVDLFGTLALLSVDASRPGVSVDIHVSYVAAAKQQDEDVLITGRVTKTGRTLAYTSVALTGATSGKIFATGSHTKFVG